MQSWSKDRIAEKIINLIRITKNKIIKMIVTENYDAENYDH